MCAFAELKFKHLKTLCGCLQEDALPDCSAFPDQFDYRHNINDDQYQIFALGNAILVFTSIMLTPWKPCILSAHLVFCLILARV